VSVFSASFVNGLHKGRHPGPRISFHLPYDGRGGGVITFVVSEEFPISVNEVVKGVTL